MKSTTIVLPAQTFGCRLALLRFLVLCPPRPAGCANITREFHQLQKQLPTTVTGDLG